MGKSSPNIAGQSKCSQTMNCCWNFLGNSRIHIVVPRGPRLLPSAPFTLYVCICTNTGLGSSLSKHAFWHTGNGSSNVEQRFGVIFVNLTGKFVAYLILLNLTSIIWSVCDSHSESEEESGILSGLSESRFSLISSGSDIVLLDAHV